MAEKDPDGPSLELPSLRLGRRKRARPEPPPAPSEEPAPAEPPVAEPAYVATAHEEPVETGAAGPPREPAPDASPPRPARTLPRLSAVPAALVTGLLVGAVTVGLVWASQGVCELVRGTSSCGNAGFLLLLAVLVVAGWLGSALLRVLGVPDGGGTSFLAMGLVAVVLMLFLSDQLFAWWVAPVVPVVAMLSYVAAQRLTTVMVEPRGREMHR